MYSWQSLCVMDSLVILQISINGQVHNVGTVVRVSNHYMVGIVLGILAALVAGAVLAFVVMKHLRKKKKGGLLYVTWTLVKFDMNYKTIFQLEHP